MKISNIHKTYPSFSLNIDSMTLETGINGLIGPNGCGKSTLIKILAGTNKAETGTIEHDLTTCDITMVPRKPYLLNTTVYNNIIYPLKIRKLPIDDDKINDMLEYMELTKFKDERAKVLSGGQVQKLALIRCLIFEPKIIFLDEAFSNMDMSSIEKCEDLILNIQKEKPITWLIVSHQLAHITRLCDTTYFMSNGRLLLSGDTHTILNSDNPELKKFLSQERF